MPKYRVIQGKIFKRYPKLGLVCHRAGTDTDVGEFDIDFYEKNKNKLEPLSDSTSDDDEPELPFNSNPPSPPAPTITVNPKPIYVIKPRGGGWYDVVDSETGARVSSDPMHKNEAEAFIVVKKAEDDDPDHSDNS